MRATSSGCQRTFRANEVFVSNFWMEAHRLRRGRDFLGGPANKPQGGRGPLFFLQASQFGRSKKKRICSEEEEKRPMRFGSGDNNLFPPNWVSGVGLILMARGQKEEAKIFPLFCLAMSKIGGVAGTPTREKRASNSRKKRIQ